MSIGSKVIILGCPGSGKSTLARKLHEKTGLPLIHLDQIWWRADKTHISQGEFDRRLGEALAGDRWIIDGNYSRTYDVRLSACDTVFFLDYGEEICLDSLKKRMGKKRPDLPWIEDTLDPELVEVVKHFHLEQRPVIYEMLEKFPDKQVHIFQTREQAEVWLSACFS